MAGKHATQTTPVGALGGAASQAENTSATSSGTSIDAELAAELLSAVGGLPEPARKAEDDDGDDAEATVEAAEETEAKDGSADGSGDEPAADGSVEDSEAKNESETAEQAEGDDEPTEEQAEEPTDQEQQQPQSEEGKTPSNLQKRFDELTAKIYERDRKIAELETRVNAQTQQAAAAQAAARPLTRLEEQVLDARNPQELATIHRTLQEMEDFAMAHPDGVEVPAANGEVRQVSRDEIADTLVRARKAQRLVPERAALLQAQAQYDAAAAVEYPEFADPVSEASRIHAQLVALIPDAARKLPQLRMIVGDALRGQKLREEAAKTKAQAQSGQKVAVGKPVAKPAAVKQPPQVPVAPLRVPKAVPPKEARLANARQRMLKSGGSESALADFIEAATPTVANR